MDYGFIVVYAILKSRVDLTVLSPLGDGMNISSQDLSTARSRSRLTVLQ